MGAEAFGRGGRAADAGRLGAYLAIPAATTPAWFGEALAHLSDESGVPQVWLARPGSGEPRALTAFGERIGTLVASPRGDRLVFGMDAGANEHEALWLIEAGAAPRPLTQDPATIHQMPVVAPDGRLVAYASNARDRRWFDVWVRDLEPPEAPARLVLARDELLAPLAWSSNGRWLLVSRANTNLDQDLLLVPAEGGEARLLTPHAGEATVLAAAFASEGDALYVATNQDREFAALVRLDPATLTQTPVVEAGWDVEALAVGRGGWLAYAVNVDGFSRAVLRHLASGEERPVAGLPPGVVDGLTWTTAGDRLAFRLHGAQTPSSIWICGLDGVARRVVGVDQDGVAGVPFVAPETVRYPSFDGREIPALWFRPRGAGPWPVVIDVHGGPESQRRPDFAPLTQFLVAQGFAVLAPNVRGSTGYGKTYCHLDDVERRPDAVADLAAAVEWLRGRPEAAPDRIAVLGRSYGGFMALAALTTYPELWAAGVDIVGIANFVTFLERTGPWRRRTRAAEYGDPERDAALLTAISPIHRAERIAAPLLVIHGRNDPRVPVAEAEQIAARLRGLGRDVELIVFDDEGHQMTKLGNRLTAYGRVADFLARTLNGEVQGGLRAGD